MQFQEPLYGAMFPFRRLIIPPADCLLNLQQQELLGCLVLHQTRTMILYTKLEISPFQPFDALRSKYLDGRSSKFAADRAVIRSSRSSRQQTMEV